MNDTADVLPPSPPPSHLSKLERSGMLADQESDFAAQTNQLSAATPYTQFENGLRCVIPDMEDCVWAIFMVYGSNIRPESE